MHELSITQSVVDLVAERTAGRTVVAVRMRVGRLSGVLPDALLFSYDIATMGSPIEDSRLDIEETDGQDLLVVAVELEKETTCA